MKPASRTLRDIRKRQRLSDLYRDATLHTASRASGPAQLVRWSDEDGCYVGLCPGVMYGGVHGDDEMKVRRWLCQVVDEWEGFD